MHSLESVAFQTKSEFYPDVIAAVQCATAAVAKLQIRTPARIVNAINGSLFQSQLRAAVKKHINYDLTHIYLTPAWEPMLGVLNTIQGVSKFNIDKDIRSIATGQGNGKESPSLRLKKAFAAISDGVSPSTGAIDEKYASQVMCRLVISAGLFCVTEHSDTDPFTNEEIAAFILHEMGHVVDMADICGWFTHRTALVRDTLQSFDSDDAPSQESLKDLVLVLRNKLRSLSSSKDVVAMGKILDQADKALANPLPDEIRAKVEQSLKVVTSSLIVRVSADEDNYIVPKDGDIVITKNMTAYRERAADEFAVKYGAGPALASGLKKLLIYSDLKRIRATSDMLSVIRGMIYYHNALQYIGAVLDMQACTISDGYDSNVDRLKKTVETMQGVFKDLALPADVTADCIRQVKYMQTELDAYTKASHVRTREAIFTALKSFFTALTRVVLIGGNTVESDYKNLYNLTEQLIKNPMHYHLARTKQLLDK